jgi:site-specific recombinase XerD
MDDLAVLLPSWKLAMQARGMSRHTIASYISGVQYYLEWCESSGGTPLDRHTLSAWISNLLAQGAEAATARIRHQAVRRFSAWLAAEGEIDADPFLGMQQPKVDAKVVEPLTEDDLRLLIKACSGRELRDRRDEAILRLLSETGLRAGELLALNTHDVDLARGLVTIRRGKGGAGRVVPIGAATSAAVDRYVRARRHHRLAGSPALWLTETGSGNRLTYAGLRVALLGRARAAGVENFHIHRIRHTFASRWLGSEGSEQGLMAVAGWRSRHMLDRYTAFTASVRAADEARRLGLGDL